MVGKGVVLVSIFLMLCAISVSAVCVPDVRCSSFALSCLEEPPEGEPCSAGFEPSCVSLPLENVVHVPYISDGQNIVGFFALPNGEDATLMHGDVRYFVDGVSTPLPPEVAQNEVGAFTYVSIVSDTNCSGDVVSYFGTLVNLEGSEPPYGQIPLSFASVEECGLVNRSWRIFTNDSGITPDYDSAVAAFCMNESCMVDLYFRTVVVRDVTPCLSVADVNSCGVDVVTAPSELDASPCLPSCAPGLTCNPLGVGGSVGGGSVPQQQVVVPQAAIGEGQPGTFFLGDWLTKAWDWLAFWRR